MQRQRGADYTISARNPTAAGTPEEAAMASANQTERQDVESHSQTGKS